MNYRGRIVLTFIILLLGINAKLYGHFYYNYPLYNFPFLLIFSLAVAWWIGGFYDQVKFLSEKDTLTKIYNRRFVKQTFPRMLALAKSKKESLSLLFIDVNHFKKINDTYGHDVGDKALLYISEVILKNSSKSDIVARWAGDEFLIIAHFISKEDIKLKVEKIHSDLKMSSDDIHIDLSVSIGVSVYPRDGNNLDTLLKIADQNLYKSKSKLALKERA